MAARRDVRQDRRGRPAAVVTWRADGTLESAAVRIPAGDWISIEPRAGIEPPWGAVDRLWMGDAPDRPTTALSVMGAVNWHHLAAIPPLAEPARLPPGAGTAVLNLIAGLAREQHVQRLGYGGPYPTEALFLALLECFRPAATEGDLLARFMANDLAWIPAPFVPSFDDVAYVQRRDDRIEKVVWAQRAYYRETWGPVRRLAPLRVHDAGPAVRCSLWALGEPIADHLIIGPDGEPHVVAPAPTPDAAPPDRRLAPAVREALVALVVVLSAPPLAAALLAVCATLAFRCGPVRLDLAEVGEREVVVADALAHRLARRLASADDRATRAREALMALTELAAAIADPLRLRAQARLAAAAPDVQLAALRQDSHDPDTAPAIAGGVATVVASGRVDDEPDVEGDERGDRDD